MSEKIKNFLKATETIVVLGGCLLTFLLGKFWLLPLAVTYTLLNLPNAVKYLKRAFHVGTRPPKPPRG